MLKLMRDSFQQLKWILVAIVAVFILFIFVDWGAGGAGGRAGDDRSYVARVNGETIAGPGFVLCFMPVERGIERILSSDENHARVSGGFEKSDRSGNRDRRAMIASHRIDGQRDGHDVRRPFLL